MAQSSLGRRILDVVLQVFFWVFLAVQVFAMAILLKKVQAGIDIFPWSKNGLGDDVFVMLLYWFGVLLSTVVLYIFDSVGPCILSRLTYLVLFIIPFVYPFVGGPAFFIETLTVASYVKVVKVLTVAGYLLMAFDMIRYFVAVIVAARKK